MKKHPFIKSLLVILCFLQFSILAKAQYATEFFLTDAAVGVQKEAVQKNLSLLLTQFNTALSQKRLPDFAGIAITADAQNTIRMLWQNIPFRCGETEVVERCLKTVNGYQVRNVPIFLAEPTDGSQSNNDKYQEAVIGFTAKGQINDFHLAISSNLYSKVLKDGRAVSDFRRRQMILDYVEQFRTAYNTKDLNFLNQIFSEDALIITGKVITSVPNDMNGMKASTRVEYSKQSKKEYLSRLKRIFAVNKRINVIFDDLKVVKHPAKEGYYGVTLKQGYSSDNYSDDGYLFLLWDFTNEEAPKIHVRTWQPSMLDASTKLPEEEIFTCDDFDIE